MKDTKAITMKNGKLATQGVCPVCGTKMFRKVKELYRLCDCVVPRLIDSAIWEGEMVGRNT